MVTRSRAEQPAKVSLSITVMPSGRLISLSEEEDAKALLFSVVKR